MRVERVRPDETVQVGIRTDYAAPALAGIVVTITSVATAMAVIVMYAKRWWCRTFGRHEKTRFPSTREWSRIARDGFDQDSC